MSDDTPTAEEWDDPGTDPVTTAYAKGFVHGLFLTALIELAVVGAWFLIAEVVL